MRQVGNQPPVPQSTVLTPNRPVRLGLDAYSLRSQGWTPFQLLEFCGARGLDVLHLSEIRFLGGLEREHLRRVRAYASELGIDLEIGMRSICPSSTIFEPSAGTATEQLTKVIEAATMVGSPIVRCVLGRFGDRTEPGGIEPRIDETIAVLRSLRTRVVDGGLKVAVENHAGDMQARELKMLVEAAGTDFVGVCLDSGNSLWALEDPHLALDVLAPYVLTSHMRDGVVWNVPDGAAVSWTRMGEGQIGIERYIGQYLESCPGCPVSLEVIVTDEPRVLAHRERGFWDGYRSMPAWELARFLALADRGARVQRRPAAAGESVASRELADVHASVEWTRAALARLVQAS
jgi:sugar phosphate isomerase/epimerase